MAIFTLEEARALLPRVKEITQHSYEIVEELQTQLEATERPREVRRLEAQGWVKGRWGTSENNRRARFYELTPAGLRQLDSERQAWERFSTALGLILRAE